MDAENIVRNIYGGIAEDLKEVVNILTMSPESNGIIWSMIHSVFNMILPVGLMVAATFVLITILERAILFKTHNIESVVKMLLLFVFGKVLVENSFEIMGWFYQVVAGLIGNLGSMPNAGASEADIAAMAAAIEGMGFADRLWFKVQTYPTALIMGLLKVGIKVIAYGRLMELYVYTAVAPLPLATLVSETHAGIAKRFLQGYLGVCIQGLVMLLSIMIYSALEVQLRVPVDADSMMSGGIGFLLSSLVLLLVMIRAGSWAKTIVGLM